MKQYLKMADVFEGMVAEGLTVNGPSIHGKNHAFYANTKDRRIAVYAANAINSHDELVQMSHELLAELKSMAKAYVNLLEAGKDRIESLGGDCDEVTYMAAHDVDLVHACGVIGKYDGGE